MGFRIVGITGGIGSGKSTVSHYLSSLGADLIDADSIARELADTRKDMIDILVEHFGKCILNQDGKLDRRVLARIVFEDTNRLKELNHITHKFIADEIVRRVLNIKAEKEKGLIVIDAPLPVKHGFLDLVDEVWVVYAPENVRIDRIMSRNGLTREEALKIIASQMKEDDYLKLADRIIYNSGSMEDLKCSVFELYCKNLQVYV